MRMTDLKAGWAIVGNDGRRLGTVQSAGQNYIIASRSGRPGKLYVPASHVANVENEVVYLNLAKGEAEAMGWNSHPGTRDAPESSAATDLHRHV